MLDFALYIHIPFCLKKCTYCDFYSSTDMRLISAYLKALEKEIWQYRFIFPPHTYRLASIYLGGGTPTLLPSRTLVHITELLKSYWSRSENLQISCEANPGTVTENKLSELMYGGIDRITIGIQSFCNDELMTLGRLHNAREAEKAINDARSAGCKSIGIDLIFAIPGQGMKSWQNSLDKAIAQKPHHISVYGLTIEENTPLYRSVQKKETVPIDEELQRKMYVHAINALKNAGYEQYEISNFALPGHESVHNKWYWQHKAYIGLGPAAHSYDGSRRCCNIADVRAYNRRLYWDQSPLKSCEVLDKNQNMIEALFLSLRQKKGVDLKQWQAAFSQDLLRKVTPVIERWNGLDNSSLAFSRSKTNQFLICKQNRLQLTLQGVMVYDSICSDMTAALD